jgi:putative ABC transport system permease protein
MNILTIALRNARKKWVRTSLLLLVFSLGVVSIVALSFVSRVVGEGLEKKLVSFGANILVSPKSEKLTVSYGGFALGDMLFDVTYLDESATEAKINAIALRKNISVIAPKLVVLDRVANTAAAIVGVRFDREKLLKGYWTVAQGDFPTTPEGLLVGSEAAAKLGLKLGDAVPLNVAGGERTGARLVVQGILAPTGNEDDNVLLADLEYLQRLTLWPGKVNFVEVAALCSACPIDDIVSQLGVALPGTEIKTLRGIVQQRMVSVDFVKKLIFSVSLVILLTGCSMVGISMLSAVNERKKEIGILRSLGFPRRSVFAIFCAEAAAVGLLAGLVGYVAGYLVSFRILAVLEIQSAGVVSFEPLHLVATALVLALLTSLASLFPAWKAASIEPSEALVTL